MLKIVVNLIDTFYEVTSEDINVYLEENKKLHEVVTFFKNKITEYYENKSWDRYKKLTNEYELIFSSPNTSYNISKYIPVSRSFFKLWEILVDFKDTLFPSSKNIKCLFLAEGPGGFAEAFIKFRHDFFKNVNDDYLGMTLKSNNKNIPDWKYRHPKLKVTYGEDGTGNLYTKNNIKFLEKQYGLHSFDFITADGGFDFSADFNNQEEMSFHLLVNEICTALKLQKEGGALIIKIFDIFTILTIKLINLVAPCYKQAFLFKPLTSRPANSEKYLICNGFKDCNNINPILDQLINVNADVDYVTNALRILENVEINTSITKNTILFNTFYISRQVTYIQKTIDYIKRFSNQGDIKKIIDGHVKKVQNWCIKYHIPYREE